MEEALHDVPLYYQFARLDPGMSRLPCESTILRFRHLLEERALSLQIMAVINATQASKGLMLKTGTVVDATLIAAPGSTKNKDGVRDPEMHQMPLAGLAALAFADALADTELLIDRIKGQ